MNDLRPILLVEDNPNDIELTLTALKQCNIANEVMVLRDGAEALDYVYRQGAYAHRPPGEPSVILLDLKLPKVDGLEVLERIKSDADHKHIPIVMLTSSKEEKDLVRSYQFGVNSFVVKPVEFSDFFEAIRNLGMFWAILNQTPPPQRSGSTRADARELP
ncbi:MAG TPA: response regulator [Bordetella sp.]|nr:response regulator [Bordetella sp.]